MTELNMAVLYVVAVQVVPVNSDVDWAIMMSVFKSMRLPSCVTVE